MGLFKRLLFHNQWHTLVSTSGMRAFIHLYFSTEVCFFIRNSPPNPLSSSPSQNTNLNNEDLLTTATLKLYFEFFSSSPKQNPNLNKQRLSHSLNNKLFKQE